MGHVSGDGVAGGGGWPGRRDASRTPEGEVSAGAAETLARIFRLLF